MAASRLVGTPVLSVRAGGIVSRVSELIVEPEQLSIMAFRLQGGVVGRSGPDFMLASSVREYSSYGIVIDDAEELVRANEIVRLAKVLELNFSLIGLKVQTRKKTRIGKVTDFTVTSEDFLMQQLIVKRPIVKSLMDPELTIPREQIVEVDDYKIIIKDEESKIKEKAEKEEFVPNFVNPFRNSESGFAPADTKNPGGKGTE